ncbi:MAG: aspartate kinase, partial [Anaerolineaceae bacterium]|nr:aspartate kinase [Anaerolineaceae bacterium]
KFGGSSVGSADAIIKTSEIIKSQYQQDKAMIIVISAMSGITNLLIACARNAAAGNKKKYQKDIAAIKKRHFNVIKNLPINTQSKKKLIIKIEGYLDKLRKYCASILTMGEVTPRGLDAIASLGERMNIRQISALVSGVAVPNQPVDADQLIITDAAFQNAHPLLDKTCEKTDAILLPLLKSGIVPIITGFISATEDGITTTLGRGGSDYTASLLGNCLNAREVWTWTDVDGVMTADPSIVADAKMIDRLSFDEVSEMAYFGAKVLHPKTMRPLMDRDIPLWVKNTFNPACAGTCISKTSSQKSGKISCVTTIHDVSLLTVQGKGMLGVPGVAARTFSAVAKENASVLMISQSSSEQSICFVIPSSDEDKVIRSLKNDLAYELSRGDVDAINALSHVVIVTAIGAAMRQTPGVSAKIFTALGKKNINVFAIAQGSSEYSLSMVLSENEANSAVQQIHTEVIINGNK